MTLELNQIHSMICLYPIFPDWADVELLLKLKSSLELFLAPMTSPEPDSILEVVDERYKPNRRGLDA